MTNRFGDLGVPLAAWGVGMQKKGVQVVPDGLCVRVCFSVVGFRKFLSFRLLIFLYLKANTLGCLDI